MIITKENINTLLNGDKPYNVYKFLKNVKVEAVEYSKASKEDINSLGTLDNVTYTDEVLNDSIIIKQYMKDGSKDFYSVRKQVFEENYGKYSENQTHYIKQKPVEMIKIDDLNILSKTEENKFEASFGLQDINDGAFIVLNNGDYYICNIDLATNLPVGYIEINKD